MARIASGNYDAVIVSHRSFEFLPVSDKLFKRFVEEQVEELEAAILEAKAGKDDNRRLVKELEKAKKRFVAKLKERADREGKDNALTFEELGVDQIFVDEADLYKNLFYTTKMNRIAGLPNSESNRALDMYMKTRYVRETSGGRGVVFATGTPISNTMAEMYTMLRYLTPDLLKERGVAHFDAWAANFAEAVTALELAPDGSGCRGPRRGRAHLPCRASNTRCADWTRPWRRSGTARPALKRCWGIFRNRRAGRTSTRCDLRNCWAARPN